MNILYQRPHTNFSTPVSGCGRKYERGSWAEMSHGGNIVTVNAFYSPNSNTMIVPIGMLQDPLYWSQPKVRPGYRCKLALAY